MSQITLERQSAPLDLIGLGKAFIADLFVGKPAFRTSKYSAKELQELWYPTLTEATEQLIDTRVAGLVNVTVGGNKHGPAMLLWPSLMMKGSMWNFQYEHFRKNYRMVLIDSPGINKSEGLRKLIDLRDCKDIVVDILDALKIDKCVFGGNSWGAMLAAVLPAWIPERLLGTMVINGTASLPTLSETILVTARAEALMMNEFTPDWWAYTAQTAFTGDSAIAENGEFMSYIGCVTQEDPKSIAWAIRGILLGRKDMHPLLRTIKNVPVMVIAGAEDRQFDVATCKKMADAIEGCKFVVVPGVAHLASRERPDEINKEMEIFLGEIGAQ